MSSLVSDAAAVEFVGRTPWPKDAKLYQPYETEQILVADLSNCVAVRVFLNMCSLKYDIVVRKNAEFMSPSGKLPFLHAAPMIISEFEPIVQFVQNKGTTLSTFLSDEQRSEMKAFMSLITNTLQNAELWMTWCEPTVASTVSRPRYGHPFVWPLNVILPFRKQRECVRQLNQSGWGKKSLEQVCEEVRTCCEALSAKLGDQHFFFGDKPTELDALVFGHLYSVCAAGLPKDDLARIITNYPNLARFMTLVNGKFVLETELNRYS